MTPEETKARNIVNFDALQEAGAIHFDTIVSRAHTIRLKGWQEPDGIWGSDREGKTFWIPSTLEDPNIQTNPALRRDAHLMGERRAPQKAWRDAFSKGHIERLVARGLRGEVVPYDIKCAIDDPGVLGLYNVIGYIRLSVARGTRLRVRSFLPWAGWAESYPIRVRLWCALGFTFPTFVQDGIECLDPAFLIASSENGLGALGGTGLV